MGASQSCRLCPSAYAKTKQVLVMKEDGEVVSLKDGAQVENILAAYPFHKVLRCCSDRTVLAESCRLNSKWLYFLLPEGLSVNDITYQSLIRAAVSRGLIFSEVINQKAVTENKNTITNEQNVVGCKVILSCDDDFGYKKSIWKPALQTVQEVTSPSLHTNV